MLPGTEKKARGARLFLGVAAGWRPFLVRPDSSAPFKRPGGKRAPVAHGHREAGALARARPAREEAAPSPKGPIGPGKTDARGRREGRRRNRGGFGFGGGGFANPDIGGLPEALDVRRPLSRGGGPCDDAAIEPASRVPKKGLAYRRASAGSDAPSSPAISATASPDL